MFRASLRFHHISLFNPRRLFLFFCSRAPTDSCGTRSPRNGRYYTPRAVVGTSISAPHPTTSDVEFVPNWVIVAGNQQVLFEDSACPGNVGSLGLVRFFRTPDWLSSLFLSSAGETTITIGLIPLTTSLTREVDGPASGMTIGINASVVIARWLVSRVKSLRGQMSRKNHFRRTVKYWTVKYWGVMGGHEM